MGYFGIPFRNGVPIGLGSVVSFGAQQFDPSELFVGGTAGAWYDPSDLSTMFDTSTGTTPVAMPGLGAPVPVGLMLDKSQGLVLGSELVTNGDFSSGTTTGWTDISGGILSIDNGKLKITNGVANTGGAYQSISTVAGGLYKIRVTCTAGNTVGRLLLGTSVAGTQIYANFGFLGTLDFYFVAQSTTTWITLRTSSFTAGEFIFFDDITVKALPGNHAIAFNDTTARPELRARVNLLTYSEQFDNGAWVKNALNTTGTPAWVNAAVAPNGTTTADLLLDTASSAEHYAQQSFSCISGVSYTFSGYVKQYTYTTCIIRTWLTGSIVHSVDFSAGTISGGGTLTNVGNGWYRFEITRTASATGTAYIESYVKQTGSYVGTGTDGHYVWGFDVRPANIGANVPAYQRIADANTYDTSGFPLYLRFDGIDDSMYTPANLNLSGTDKVAVFAGVRKLSDAAAASLVEFSANTSLNTGTFATYAPGSAAANYVWRSYGTGIADVTATTFSAPITNVLTGIGNIGGDISQLRANGSVAGTNTGDQGTGNFGTYPLFIGARNNSSLWFNGHLHSLIIAGSAVSAGNISATEQWVANKTGITI